MTIEEPEDEFLWKSPVRAAYGLVRANVFGIAILLCAAMSFAFPSAFAEWGGVKLTSLVVPAIQVIMFGMGTTL